MLLLRPIAAAAPPALRRSPPARRRPAPEPPSACAECVRKESLQRKKKKKTKRTAEPLVAFAAKLPGFDDDERKTSTSTSSSSSPSADPGDTLPDDGPALSAALALLRFYRNSLSPLLPKSCRFLPSCSEYAQISYRRFGVVRGTALTAWRLLRCNPLNPGRSFYDPPRWPPVGLEWAFGGGGGGGGSVGGDEEGGEEEKK